MKPETETTMNPQSPATTATPFQSVIRQGGAVELLLAAQILKAEGVNKDGSPCGAILNIRQLVEDLTSCQGCYYIRRKPPESRLRELHVWASGFQNEIGLLAARDSAALPELEASLLAVRECIKGDLEILTDFTIDCRHFIRRDHGEYVRIFNLLNRHGESRSGVEFPAKHLATAARFREFCMSQGNFHSMLSDRNLQDLMQHLSELSQATEIVEINRIGHDAKSGIWFFGDCAFLPTADLFSGQDMEQNVIFRDENGLFQHDGVTYHTPFDQAAHGAPTFFASSAGEAPFEQSVRIEDRVNQESTEVARIFRQLAADMVATMGGPDGLLLLGSAISYLFAPELREHYNGHPGIWIQGMPFSGKTETTRFLMQFWGFPADYRPLSLAHGTTQVALERVLSDYSSVPVHLDEFREGKTTHSNTPILRAAFTRQAKSVGTMDQTNRHRRVQPHTSPIITGHSGTSDSATLSRYVQFVISEATRMGSKDEVKARYSRMLDQAPQYHRITRLLLLMRDYVKDVFMDLLGKTLVEYARDPQLANCSERMRFTHATAIVAISTVSGTFAAFLEMEPGHDGASKSGISPEDDARLSEAHLGMADHVMSLLVKADPA